MIYSQLMSKSAAAKRLDDTINLYRAIWAYKQGILPRASLLHVLTAFNAKMGDALDRDRFL